MRVTFLFWNICQRPLEHIITNLSRRHEIDLIMLAECVMEPTAILKRLNSDSTSYHYVQQLGCTRIEIFTRFPDDLFPAVYEEDKITIRQLQIPGLTEILVAIIHFPSKLRWESEDQGHEATRYARKIRETEQQVGHSRTIIVGDMNMNPFESGLVSTHGFHGVMCRSVAKERSRIVQGCEYPYFYNPMWNLFGDTSPGPPGTFYYRDAVPRVFFWNMFDQVLVRPDLMDRFANQDLKVLEGDGTSSFLRTDGLPDPAVGSDHLPILFRLNL